MSVLKTLTDKLWRKHKTLSTISVSIIGLCVARAIYCYIHRKYNKYPPGPIGLPFIGNMITMLNPIKLESHLASTYGAISMVYIAQQPFVFLHSVESIKEIFNNESALERDLWHKGFLFGHLDSCELPLPFVSSPFWMKKRKIFNPTLISRLDSQFLNEAHNQSVTAISDVIQQCIQHNKLWYPSKNLEYIMFNAIWSAAFGTYLLPNSVIQQNIRRVLHTVPAQAMIDLMMSIPLGLKDILPCSWFKYISSFSEVKNVMDYMETLVYEHLGYDEQIWNMKDSKWSKHFQDVLNDKNSCLISKLIAVHRSKPDIDSTKNSLLAELCQSLVGAGIETTQNVAEYGLVLLGKHRAEQSTIYNEIYSVFGEDWKMEKHSFKSVVHKLHFLRAFIHETLRLSAILPFGVPHSNSKDIWTKDKKYKIPKKSVIISDIYSANKCAQNGYCLEQWLDDKQQFSYNRNKDKMVSFSIGPRECAGRALALRSLYVLFIKLVLKFQFEVEDEHIEIKQKLVFTQHIHPSIGLRVVRR